MVPKLYLAAPGVDYVAYAREYLGRFEKDYSDFTAGHGR